MIQEVAEKLIWEDYLKQISCSVFLLQWWWGEFQKSAGRVPYRLAWVREGRARAVVQVFFQPLAGRMGYGVVSRCPLYAGDITLEEQKQIELELAEWCALTHNKQKWIFWRWEPLVEVEGNPKCALKISNRQPQTTLLLDVSRTQEDILRAMHEKTRYNIRLSLKKGLTCRIVLASEVTPHDFNTFWDLMRETAARAGIKNYAKKYYENLFVVARKEQVSNVFMTLVHKEHQPLAAGVFIGSGDTCTYLYGASSNDERNTMAPYFMHWQMIEFAYTHGFQWYDWWGVNPENANHTAYKKSWEGITRFKEGFGSVRTAYPSAREIPIDVRTYTVYQLLRKVF